MKKLSIIILLFVCYTGLMFSHNAVAVNDTSGDTWVLDSTGSVTTSRTHITWLIWTGITNDGDDLVIKESAAGHLIIRLKGKAGIDMFFPFYGSSGVVPSFYVDTIDSGTVLVRKGVTR